MKPEDKRKLNDFITNNFLTANVQIVDSIIQKFIVLMNAALINPVPIGGNYNFYLKGSKAISILTNNPVIADYDFQLMPPLTMYANWNTFFPQIEQMILNVLYDTIDQFATHTALIQGRPFFNVDTFRFPALSAFAQTAGISIGNLRLGEKRSGITTIGRNFGAMTYHEIITHDRFINGFITLNRDEIVIDDSFVNDVKRFGPMIYVNYTIPGFILYRIVYSFDYTMGEETFNLKSEIIDVSVPRPGSAEIYMSQQGVVTHFRTMVLNGTPFNIPGWGYHFYENINMLQEIELGISGSPHKKPRRIERLKTAIDTLIAANAGAPNNLNVILSMVINEPIGNLFGNIVGYVGALTYNIDAYNQAYNLGAIGSLRNSIASEIIGHFEISESLWGKSKFRNWQKLVYFHLSEKFDKAVNTVLHARQLLMPLIGKYNGKCDTLKVSVEINMTLGTTFQFISPLIEPVTNSLLPSYYVVVQVTSNVFTQFHKFCKDLLGRRITSYPGDGVATAFICKLNSSIPHKEGCFKGVLNVIFQDCGQNLPVLNTHLPDFLNRTIIESQRHPLRKAFQGRL